MFYLGLGDIYWINFYDLGGIVPHLTPMYIRLKIKGGPKKCFRQKLETSSVCDFGCDCDYHRE